MERIKNDNDTVKRPCVNHAVLVLNELEECVWSMGKTVSLCELGSQNHRVSNRDLEDQCTNSSSPIPAHYAHPAQEKTFDHWVNITSPTSTNSECPAQQSSCECPAQQHCDTNVVQGNCAEQGENVEYIGGHNSLPILAQSVLPAQQNSCDDFMIQGHFLEQGEDADKSLGPNEGEQLVALQENVEVNFQSSPSVEVVPIVTSSGPGDDNSKQKIVDQSDVRRMDHFPESSADIPCSQELCEVPVIEVEDATRIGQLAGGDSIGSRVKRRRGRPAKKVQKPQRLVKKCCSSEQLINFVLVNEDSSIIAQKILDFGKKIGMLCVDNERRF
ncbi:hypothetical protein SESBI_31261 [Sesbania bispinosa]|nr:hypothetical protein SESBI_31261 [Sesbania bispinosa]